MDWRTHLSKLICLAALCLPAWAAPDGKALYEKHCAGCHDAALPRVPNRDTLQQLSPQAIVDALERGAMRKQGMELAPEERRVVAGAGHGGTIQPAR
jgi:mono/diheme cytochrome c family protein